MAGVKYRSSGIHRLHVLRLMPGEALSIKAKAEAPLLEHAVDQQRTIQAELLLVDAVVASAAKEERETLFRRFLVYSGLVVALGPLLAWLVFVVPGWM